MEAIDYSNPECVRNHYNCYGVNGTINEEEDKYYRCKACHKAKRKQEVSQGKVLPIYIVAYEISRHYGGREEGGWYYDWTTIHDVRKVWSIKDALKVVRELKEAYPQPRYNRHSVLGSQDEFISLCYDTNQFPKESTERPHYE